MKLENEFTVPAPIDEAWAVLLDVERVAPCLPGAAVEPGGDDGTYSGTMTVKIGPITARYKGTVKIQEADEAARRAIMRAQAKDARGQGTAAATITSTMEETGDGTRVKVVTDMRVTGPAAQFGRGVMQDVSAKMMRQFAECLASEMSASPEPASAAPAAPAPAGGDGATAAGGEAAAREEALGGPASSGGPPLGGGAPSGAAPPRPAPARPRRRRRARRRLHQRRGHARHGRGRQRREPRARAAAGGRPADPAACAAAAHSGGARPRRRQPGGRAQAGRPGDRRRPPAAAHPAHHQALTKPAGRCTIAPRCPVAARARPG